MATLARRSVRPALVFALLTGWFLLLWPANLPASDVLRTALLLARATMLLLLPGLALVLLLRPFAEGDPLQALCLAPLVSLALFPVLLLWTGLLGGAWGGTAVLVLLGASSLVLLWRLARTPLALPSRGSLLWAGALGGVFALALAVRLMVIRGVPYPSWIDSYHHTLITQKIMEGGRVPQNYLPYAPMEGFHYHFGFHTFCAFLGWLTGLPAHRAVLWGGQVLNALTVPSLFLFVDRIARDRRAALLAAAIAGLVCWLPAYYVNWGRYPQLAGQLILPAGIVLLWEAARREKGGWRSALLGALVAAAVGLTHYRVAIFFLAGALVTATVAAVRARRAPGRILRTAARLALLGALALALVLPWLPSLLGKSSEAAQEVAARGDVGQTDYFTLDFVLAMGLPRRFLMASLAGAVWVLARARRRPLGALILLWLGLLIFLANPEASGIPSGFIENGAVIVALYLPAALVLGLAISDAADLLTRRTGRRWWVEGAVALGLAVAVYLGVGDKLAWGFEPGRQFVTNSDLAAFQWIAEQTPPGARFAVASNFWLAEGLEGVDGGQWIPYATGRQVSVPPMIYINEATPEQIATANALARRMTAAASPPEFAGILREEGIGYAYRGLRKTPSWYAYLEDSAAFELLYDHESVRIYRLR
ncbi:MAG: hypothetical protein GX657_17715 [Chloroflexi bacterium]|nr:hypothetical protein [Chloroflexota bacterium]